MAWKFDASGSFITKCDTMRHLAKLTFSTRSPRCAFSGARATPDPVAARIDAFLDGKTDGQELLHALYDHILEEPIPQSMRALLDK